MVSAGQAMMSYVKPDVLRLAQSVLHEGRLVSTDRRAAHDSLQAAIDHAKSMDLRDSPTAIEAAFGTLWMNVVCRLQDVIPEDAKGIVKDVLAVGVKFHNDCDPMLLAFALGHLGLGNLQAWVEEYNDQDVPASKQLVLVSISEMDEGGEHHDVYHLMTRGNFDSMMADRPHDLRQLGTTADDEVVMPEAHRWPILPHRDPLGLLSPLSQSPRLTPRPTPRVLAGFPGKKDETDQGTADEDEEADDS